MKRIALILSAAALALVGGCLERSTPRPESRTGTLLRLHFSGTAAIEQSAEATKLKAILGLPTTTGLRNETLGKLARAPHTFWRKSLPAGVPDQAGLIQPLLQDLVRSEWLLETRGPVGASETILAVRLADDRARAWNDALGQIIAGWKLGAATPLKSGTGWELHRADPPLFVQSQRAGQWVLLGFGSKPLTLLTPLAQKAAKGESLAAAAKDSVLEVNADLPALRPWFPVLAKFPLPPARLNVLGRGETLRTELRLTYSDKLPLKLDAWQIPRNFINDPLISFTAIRGFAPLWSQFTGFDPLRLDPPPNQLFLWGMDYKQTQLFFAYPSPNPTNAVKDLAVRLPIWTTNFLERSSGSFMFVSNRSEVFWQGLPFIIPNVRPMVDGRQSYVSGGLIPLPGRTNPPPPDLYAQFVSRDNVVYYDWELTGTRLSHARQMYQLQSILNRRQIAGTNAPVERWLLDLVPQLGNSITEVTQAAPNELLLVRKSHLGLTGFELATLGRWIESPSFPFGFDQPPLIARPNPAGGAPATKAAPKR